MKILICLVTVILVGCATYESVVVGYDDGPSATVLTKGKGPLVTVAFMQASNSLPSASENRPLADDKASLRCGKEGLKAEFLSASEHSAELDSWATKKWRSTTDNFFYACVPPTE